MGQLGQASGKARHRANAGGDNFAVAPESFGAGEYAQLGQSRLVVYVAHQNIGKGKAFTASIPPNWAR